MDKHFDVAQPVLCELCGEPFRVNVEWQVGWKPRWSFRTIFVAEVWWEIMVPLSHAGYRFQEAMEP
eukprot:scaffold1541_cov418-Prasinococcus_capsulatus_cf.AAC.25